MYRAEAILPSDEELNLLSIHFEDFKKTTLPDLINLNANIEELCKHLERIEKYNKKVKNKSRLKRRYIKNY